MPVHGEGDSVSRTVQLPEESWVLCAGKSWRVSSAPGITQFLMSVRVEGAHAEPRGDASFVRSRSRVVGGTQSGASRIPNASSKMLALKSWVPGDRCWTAMCCSASHEGCSDPPGGRMPHCEEVEEEQRISPGAAPALFGRCKPTMRRVFESSRCGIAQQKWG